MELIFLAGNYRMLAGFLNAARVELDEGLEGFPALRSPSWRSETRSEEKTAGSLRPGEQVQAVFGGQTASQYWMLLAYVAFFAQNKYRCVVVTDQRILVFDSGRLEDRRPEGAPAGAAPGPRASARVRASGTWSTSASPCGSTSASTRTSTRPTPPSPPPAGVAVRQHSCLPTPGQSADRREGELGRVPVAWSPRSVAAVSSRSMTSSPSTTSTAVTVAREGQRRAGKTGTPSRMASFLTIASGPAQSVRYRLQ